MKKLRYIILGLFISAFAKAQVGIGTTSPDPSAALDVSADIQNGNFGGIKLPSLTTTERDGLTLTATENGMLIFNSTLRAVQMYNHSETTWNTLQELETAIAPIAENVAIFGTAIVGNTLTGSYGFADGNSDEESGSTLAFYSYTDEMGSNETLLASGSNTYTITSAEDNRYVRFAVTPVDDSSTNNTGTITYSDYTRLIVTNRINFDQQAQTIAEDASPDDIDFTFEYQNTSSTAIDVTVSADDYSRLDETGPVTVTIPASAASPYTTTVFNVDDNAVADGDVSVTFTIDSVSGGDGTTVVGDTNTDTVLITDDEVSTALLSEDFESDGNGSRYTTSVAEFTDTGGDYFIRTNGSNISATYSGATGSYFAAQDIDGEVPSANQQLTFSNPISVTGGSTYTLSLDLAEDDDGTSQDWDAADYFRVEVSENGGAWNSVFAIESTGGTNTEPSQDDNLDGSGDGVNIVTDSFSNFSASFTVGATTTSIEVRLNFNLDSGDEDIAVDNIEIN